MERRATLSVTQKPFAFAFATKLTRLLRIRVFLQARYLDKTLPLTTVTSGGNV